MSIRVITLLSFCAMAMAYTDMDDKLNIEELVKNVPALQKNMDCFLDRGVCTAQTTGYKKHFDEIVDDGCKECNDRERHMFRVFIAGVKDKLPKDYELFKAKYDPNGKHFDAAVAQVKNF